MFFSDLFGYLNTWQLKMMKANKFIRQCDVKDLPLNACMWIWRLKVYTTNFWLICGISKTNFSTLISIRTGGNKHWCHPLKVYNAITIIKERLMGYTPIWEGFVLSYYDIIADCTLMNVLSWFLLAMEKTELNTNSYYQRIVLKRWVPHRRKFRIQRDWKI